MAYKYDPISKTLIDADAKFSFEETPNDDNVAAVITIEETDYILKIYRLQPFQRSERNTIWHWRYNIFIFRKYL